MSNDVVFLCTCRHFGGNPHSAQLIAPSLTVTRCTLTTVVVFVYKFVSPSLVQLMEFTYGRCAWTIAVLFKVTVSTQMVENSRKWCHELVWDKVDFHFQSLMKLMRQKCDFKVVWAWRTPLIIGWSRTGSSKFSWAHYQHHDDEPLFCVKIWICWYFFTMHRIAVVI